MHHTHRTWQSCPLDELSCTSPNTYFDASYKWLNPISFPIRTSSQPTFIITLSSLRSTSNTLLAAIASSTLLSNYPWCMLLHTRTYKDIQFLSFLFLVQHENFHILPTSSTTISTCPAATTLPMASDHPTLVQPSICRKSPVASRAAVIKYYLR